MGMTAFTLDALIRLDDAQYNKSLNNAEKNTANIGNKIGNAAKKAAKVTATAFGAAATVISGIAKSAIGAYAEYEQNIGGVETLFKESADKVVKYAQDAYRTAGVDANTYMSNVTSFSASLLQSLGGDTEKAAEIAHMAMVDMSDNANKMGTDMEAIQNAYQGFAKQNYTMLDNLKLGYGGTQEEMKRLLADAEKITGIKYDITNLSDVYEAIHVIQTELGITGTTAEEASTTIQGSINMMKASWENLKIAFVDPDGNIDEALDNFIDSAETAAANIVPAVTRALQGIGTAVKELAPVIADEFPTLITTLLPNIADAGLALIRGLADALLESLPVVLDTAVKIVESLVAMISQNASDLADSAVAILTTLANAIIVNLPSLLTSGVEIISQLATSIGKNLPDLIPAAVQMILELVKGLTDPDNLDKLVNGAVAIIEGLAQGIIAAIPILITEAPVIITNLFNALIKAIPKLIEAGAQAIAAIVQGLTENLPSIDEVWATIQAAAETAWGMIKSAAESIWGSLVSAVESIIKSLAEALGLDWDDIKDKAETVWNAISGTAELVWDAIKGFIEDPITAVKKTLSEAWETIKSTAISAWENVKSKIQPLIDGINSVIEGLVGVVKDAIEWLKELFGFDGKKVTITKEVKEQYTQLSEQAGQGDEQAMHDLLTAPALPGVIPGTAKGSWSVPYDDYLTRLHRGEMVLTKSQARQYREGEGGNFDFGALTSAIVAAVRQGLQDATVNSYLDGKLLTDEVSRIMGETLTAGRFA